MAWFTKVRASVLAVVLVTLLAPAVSVAAEPAQDSPDDPEQELVDRFAPVVMLKSQPEECSTDGEPYRPTSVDILFDNPEIALRQFTSDNPVVKYAPTPADLHGLGEGFFLDFPGSSLSPACIYERDFRKYTADQPATVYAHVVQQPDEPDLLFVQYWLYWYYNDWNNKHESDWEGITLLFEASSVDEALASGPVAVGYSQHEGGERADWDGPKLERDGDHPVVYSSAGSHASYYGSALYLGRAASEGFGCDDTSGPSDRVAPEVVLLPDSVDDPNDPLAWLEYDGRWGERQRGAFNGPTGPAVKDRWLDPAPWFEELRPSSVVIPSGDSQAKAVIDVFCGAVEGGSRALIEFTVSPARILVSLVVLVGLAMWLIGRTDWTPVRSAPLRRRRRAGQIIRTAASRYAKAPLIFAALGLVYIPAAIISGALGVLVRAIPFVKSLLSLSGDASGTNMFLAMLAGSVANLAAFVFVTSMVAAYLDADRRDFEGAKAAARLVWAKRRDLFWAFMRAYVIVGALFITIVGVPFAIRQMIRYQFAPHAVVMEDESGADALRRSSELVRGRWWHTAVMISVANMLVGVVALVTALLVLLVFSGLPLWMFSATVTLVYALVVPAAGIVTTLAYGDAVAAATSAPPAEPVDPVLVEPARAS